MTPRWRAADEAFRARLENELVERYAVLYGTRSRGQGVRSPWRRPLGFVAAATLIATVAVANVPIRRTLGLGRIVTISLQAGTRAPDQRDLLLHLLDARSGAEQVSASVDLGPTGEANLLLLLFGENIETDRLRADLEQSFPGLSAGRWRIHALEADLHTSLARMLGHRLLAIELDPGAIERSRRLVLDQLVARGWTGEVSFDQADGVRIIEVRSAKGSHRPDH